MFSYLTAKIEKNIVLTFVILLVFHASVSIVLSLIGNSQYFLDLHNFDGFWYFASDAMTYQVEAIESLKFLKESQWIQWWYAFQSHFHVRFISLIYFLTNNTNPIVFEIINGPIWAATVFIIYRTSQGLFSNSVVAPIVTTLFVFQPSVLLHSTSLLRDNFVIFSVALMCYGWVLIPKNKFSLKPIIYIGIGSFLFLSLKEYLIAPTLIIFLTYLTYTLVARKISVINILVLATFFTLIFSNIGVSEKSKAFNKEDLTLDISNKSEVKENVIEKLNSNNTDRKNAGNHNSFINIYNIPKWLDIDQVVHQIKSDKDDELMLTEALNINSVAASATASSNFKTYLVKMNDINTLYSQKIPPSVRTMELKEITAIENFLNMISQIEIRLNKNSSLAEQLTNLKIIELKNLIQINKNLLIARSDELVNKEYAWQSKPAALKILDLASARILEFRSSFYFREGATGSMVDVNVVFIGFNDMLRYLPRALQVGFFAPFPNEWGDTGEMTGRIGRIIAAIEVTILYIVLIGFLYIFFTNFSLLLPILPSLTLSLFIIVLVAYSIPNIGAIYRFRMDQILPFYIVGIIGVELLINKIRNNSILK